MVYDMRTSYILCEIFVSEIIKVNYLVGDYLKQYDVVIGYQNSLKF